MFYVCKDNLYYAGYGCWTPHIFIAIPFDLETALRVSCACNAGISFIVRNIDHYERCF